MENVLLFHIGFHKTGSTSIQRFLYDNDTELRKYGWFYPDFSEMVKPRQIALNNGFYLRLPLFKKDRGKMWKIISENLKKYNVIISEEGFSDEDIQTILSEAKKYHNNIKVIVYLRRQDLYIGSFYNQAVKAAYVHGTVNEYMENFLYYSDNYLDRLEKIGRVIGDENIIVRVYEGRQFAGSRKDVLSDFMYTIADGIEPDWERFKMPKRENPALHGRYFEIKKLLNAVEDDQYKRWPAGYVDPILQLSERYGKSYENALTEGYLTKQDRRNILDKHKKNNAQLARKYLHREDGQLFYDTNIDFPVYENERGSYIFNSKDLCMIEHIPELLEAGIDSFKIEGRMKTALYVAAVARTYRKAIDDCLRSQELYRQNMDWYREQIGGCTYREFTTGFFYGKPDENSQIYGNNTYIKGYTYLGIVNKLDGRGYCRIEQRNKFSVGDEIEIMKPDGTNVPVRVEELLDEEGSRMESAPHPKQKLFVRLSGEAEVFDILRKREEAPGAE